MDPDANADDSYDFSEADGSGKKSRTVTNCMHGCRLPVGGGTIMPAPIRGKTAGLAPPPYNHRSGGFFKCPRSHAIRLRGFHHPERPITRWNCSTTGMEFASEMAIK